jgi:hypothetical protein
MNKLVDGAITLQQCDRLLEPDPRGCHATGSPEFERALARLHRHGVDCPPPALLAVRVLAGPALVLLGRSPTDMRVLTRCSDRDRHLAPARARHGDVCDGHMSPATASRMWLAMWQRGQDEIETYRVAAARRSPQRVGLAPRRPLLPPRPARRERGLWPSPARDRRGPSLVGSSTWLCAASRRIAQGAMQPGARARTDDRNVQAPDTDVDAELVALRIGHRHVWCDPIQLHGPPRSTSPVTSSVRAALMVMADERSTTWLVSGSNRS